MYISNKVKGIKKSFQLGNSGYNFERPQSNLNWKTPHGFSIHATLSV
ncbi:hypothetical protein [Mycoplasmopsis gallopavonis]|nr:hypothetical protein [Mycoplasmopsis gallopavonis]